MKSITAMLLGLILTVSVSAEIVTETVIYKQGDTELEGYLAYDNNLDGKRPGVLVIHDWMGLKSFENDKCVQLAKMGYIAFALDIYGKGVRPNNVSEASEQAGIYRSDRALMRERANAGLDRLKSEKLCDVNRVAAIGYCFGGGTALELARSGAELAGVVSFHGNLDTPNSADAKNIKGKLLICHGADDPYVPHEQVIGFLKEVADANIDCQFIAYSGSVHAFTNPNAGNDPSQGAAYNAISDKRSWQHMRLFFEEIFKQAANK